MPNPLEGFDGLPILGPEPAGELEVSFVGSLMLKALFSAYCPDRRLLRRSNGAEMSISLSPSGVNRTGSVALASELGTYNSSTTVERIIGTPYKGFITSEIAQAGISGGSARKARVTGPTLPPR
jgi:hypothetical protein